MINLLLRRNEAIMILAILLTQWFGSVASVSPAQAGEKPDILFIAVDDLNDWVGHLGGHPQSKTPNIDRLVARGMSFRNAHCAAPACNPSRAALMSGMRPWETGIYTNGDPAQDVLKDVVTINRHFLANGYRTLGAGKIYHNFAAEGRKDGWTEWKGLFPSPRERDTNLTGMNKGHFDWGPLDAKLEEMGDYKLTDWAVNQLQTAPLEQPLFLAVGYVKPHLPWYVPREYFDRFPLSTIQIPSVLESDLSDVPSAGVKMATQGGDHAAVLKADQWKKGVQAYLATISFLDDQVGRLLDGLENSPRKNKTIVVWWTDHGWHLGEKQHWRKFSLWEESTRTSFAIAAPGVTNASARCDAPVDYTNLYPTLCELAGLEVPGHVKGLSLVNLLKDPNSDWDSIAVCSHGRGNHSARDSRYRYIRYADGSEELYDHANDPNEWTNIANDPSKRGIKAKLEQAFPTSETEALPTGDGKSNGRSRNRAANRDE
ncbi:Arylsulfatase [Pirellula sp. SH-Sr6A]|nr:Arylsulfatase [Pirellula sp. SH-Sr6A]